MILPGDQLNGKIRYMSMRDGNITVKIEAFNDRGEKVVDGTPEIAQPTTVRVLTTYRPSVGFSVWGSVSPDRSCGYGEGRV
jgi:fatty acid synthase subunit beta